VVGKKLLNNIESMNNFIEFAVFLFFSTVVIAFLSTTAYFVCLHGAKGWYTGKKMIEDEITK